MKLFVSALLIMFGLKIAVTERTFVAALVMVLLGLLGVLTYEPGPEVHTVPQPTETAPLPKLYEEYVVLGGR